MNKDTALDPISPRDLSPVVAHFADVIVDRAPPIQRRSPPPKKPTQAYSRRHIEPEPASSALLDAPSDLDPSTPGASTDAWFAASTLAPTERSQAPDDEHAEPMSDRNVLIAAAVTITTTLAVGVSLGVWFAGLS